MHNGNPIKYILAITILLVSSCTPLHRFNRLLKCHPYLFDSVKSDTIVVDSGKSIDTVFVSKTETDTFYINGGVRIERSRDTFRFYYKERNCTTYIQKTEIKPTTKVIERTIRKEISEERNKELFRLSLYVVLALLVTGFVRYLFKK